MIRAALLWLWLWLALALPLAAQDLPEWQHTSVNDFAGLLSNDDARILDEALIALHDATGIEGSVVTLTDRARYGGGDGLEPFATRLFNAWGIGDEARNDGFMLLVLRDDREARIELGAGYSAAWDAVAAGIMERQILPAFRAGRMSEGIAQGTLAVIAQIARPQAEGLAADADGLAPKAAGRGVAGWLVPLAALGIFGLAFVNIGLGLWRRLRDGSSPCPSCGGTGLVEEIRPIDATDAEGNPLPRQSVWRRCPSCGWTGPMGDRDGFARRGRKGRSGGGGFGGGRSSGGGASGRW